MGLVVFLYAASHNASTALAQNEDQDERIEEQEEDIIEMKFEVRSTREHSQRTRDDVADIKRDVKRITEIMIKEFGKK